MNNDIYNNKSGSSLQDAYARLNEAIKIRDANAKGQQYDNVNGVALNTTPIVNNASQGQQVQQQQSSPVTNDNIAIRTAGTVEQALRNIKSGFLNLGEGVIDAHIALAGIVNKEWAEEAIKFDISDTITEWMDNNLSANALYKSKTGNNLYDQSWLNDADEKIQNIVIGVEQGIGNALGFMALSSVPYVGVALTWEGSSGMALEEAIQDPYYNGNYYGAAGSAILQGGVETGLEYLLGWNPKKMGVSTKTFKTVLKELGKNFAEEGLEEVASDLITPLFNGMYTDKSLSESYDDVTLESLGETFLVGGLTGVLMTGAGEVASAAYLSPEGQKIAHDIKENEEYYQQAYENFKNNPDEEKALEEFNKVKEEVANNLLNLGQRITKLNSKYQNRLGDGIIIDGQKFSVSDKVAMDALKIKATDPRVKAIEETKDLMVKSGVPELADYKVEFITDPEKNGYIDRTNKKIYVNLNTQKAAKFILGHEITHAFENNKAYKAIYDEIVASLKNSVTSSKDSTVYEKLYNKAKKLYKKQIKNKTEAEARKYLEEEIVADYMGNNFKNFAEIQKLFTKQSTWEKFKDMIKGIRKSNRSSKAKEYYQRFLKESYGTKVEEKKQLSKAVAYSLSENIDSQGNTLSKEQQEFFKDSKVRDEDGNLMVMYHSSNSKFTVFDLGFVNLNDGKLQGFWFTNNKKQKYSFGDNSISAYINITKPINLEKITLSNLQITKLAEAAGYKNVLTSDEKILRFIKNAELNSDYDIIHYFSPSSNTELFKKYISSVIKITGYDGYILDKYDKGSLYAIAFNSNQIKSIENKNPTLNDDIRYSIADDSPLEDDFDFDFDFDLDFLLEETSNKSIAYYSEFARQEYQDYLENKRNRKIEYDKLSEVQKQQLSLENRMKHGEYKLIKSLNKHLTPEFKERYKDSKVRFGHGANKISAFSKDVEGLLVPMFHGTPNSDMYYFDSSRIGRNGTWRGAGFYLIDDYAYAKRYARENGKVILSFVNIKKPLSTVSSNITKEDFEKFTKELNATDKNEIFDKKYYSDADKIFELYDKIKNNVSFDKFISILEKTLGYDGAIYANRAEGSIVIAFKSNQIKDVANINPTDNPDIRYSIAEDQLKQPKQKLVAQLKDGKVYDIVEGKTVIQILDSLAKNEGDVIVLKENRESILTKINVLLNINDVNSDEFVNKLNDLSKEIASLVRISVETDKIDKKTKKKIRKYVTPSEYLGLSSESINEYLTARISEEIYRISVQEGRKSLVSLLIEKQKATQGKLDTLKEKYNLFVKDLYQSISNLNKEVKFLKKQNAEQRKIAIKINTLKQWAKNEINPKVNVKKTVVDGYARATLEAISKIKFTSDTARVNSSYANVISMFQEFYNNENVQEFKNKDANVSAYFDEALKYFNAIISNQNTIRSLEIDKKIQDQNYPLLSGETETQVFANVISEVRRIINAAKGITYATLNGETVIAKEVAKEEFNYQKNVKRKPLKRFFKAIGDYFISLIDFHSYTTILSHSNENSLMTKIEKQLFEAQNQTYKTHRDLTKDITDYFKKDGKKVRKALESDKLTIEFEGTKMTLGEAIGLYMMMDTDNAYSHLMGRGVEFDTLQLGQERKLGAEAFKKYQSQEIIDELAMIESIKNVNLKKGGTLTQEQLNYLNEKFNTSSKSKADLDGRIVELNKETLKLARKEIKTKIGSEYDTFITKLEKMYEISGDIYVTASEKIYGMSFGRKRKYYPTRSINTELKDIDSLTSYVNGTLNPSFTKKVVGGSNALYVGNALQVASSFANTLSIYAGVTVEIKNVNKFLNAKVDGDNTLTNYFNNNVDDKFKDRIQDLFKAMQGISTRKQTALDKIIRRIRSAAAKSALGANIKTAVIQFSSYPKAFMYLSANNMSKAFKGTKARSNDGLVDFNYAMENSAYISNRYENGNIYNIQAVGAISKIDAFTDTLMKPIELSDKATLARIWYACQYECMENGKVNLDKALKLFEEVTYNTQAQYDALGNGSITRIDNEILKSFLMYSSENRKTFSRIFEALYMVYATEKDSVEHKQAVKYLAKTGASTISSAVMVTLISTIFKALKGDYDDEEKEEIIVSILTDELAMNFIGMLPIIKDVYSAFVSGYDIQISGFAQVTDMVSVFNKHIPVMFDLDASDGERREALIQTTTKFCHLFGIPARNIINDILYNAGFIDATLNTDTVLKLKNFFYNTDTTTLNTYMKTYSKRGDKDKVSAVIQIKSKNYGAGEISDKVSNEFARLYMNGSLESFPSQLQDEYTVEGTLVKMNKEEYKHAQSVYELANEQMELMMATSQYLGLTDEEKAIAIKKLYSAYYDVAKSDTIGVEGTKFSKVSKYIDTGKYASYLAKIQSMKANTLTNKKEAVQAYVNRTNLSKAEKYLLAYLAGYSIADDGKTQVAAYLRSKGMSYKDSKTFAGIK